MGFELMNAIELRGLSIEDLEARKEALLAELDNAESKFTGEQLRGQSADLQAEFTRRNEAAQLRGAAISAVASGAGVVTARQAAAPAKAEDVYDTHEYRSAFMEYVCRGTAIPEQYRAAETTMTTDTTAVIPTTLMNDIIRKMDTYGNIWAKVRKMNIKGGVQIPILDLKPVATWVGEGASEDQKLAANQKIVFSYHGLECKIAQSLLVATVTLDAFERLFVELAMEAMIKAIEASIIAGDGVDQFLGITKDPRIITDLADTNVIELTEEELQDWSAWHKKVKAAIKKSYRNGSFIMAQSSFDGYIDGMVDQNGQPVGRVNYGINGEEAYRFMGKSVETVEEDLIAGFGTAASGDVIAIFGDLSDYGVNTNMQITATKWVDHDTNKVKNKCLMYADGKVIDPYGFLIIKKKISA